MILLLASLARAADVLAVAYFDAHTVRPELEPLGRGVADMLTTDLGGAPSLRVVERARIAEVLAELDLQRSAYVDPATAQALGKGVGATAVVVGSLTVAIEGMRIDARLVDVATGQVRATAQATGREDEFFKLEDEVARELLTGLGVAVQIEERPLTMEQILAGSKAIDAADAAMIGRLRGLGEYKQKRLVRSAVTTTQGSGTNGNVNISSTVSWIVYEGGNTPLTARQFAELVGDTKTYEEIDGNTRSGKAAAWSMWGIGATAGLVGMGMTLGPLMAMEDYRYNPTMLYGGLGLTTGGLLLASMSGIPAAKARKEGWVGNYYEAAEADDWIRRYNAALAARMGIPEGDALQLEVR